MMLIFEDVLVRQSIYLLLLFSVLLI